MSLAVRARLCLPGLKLIGARQASFAFLGPLCSFVLGGEAQLFKPPLRAPGSRLVFHLISPV